MQAPHIDHWNVVICIVRYIKKALRPGFLYMGLGPSLCNALYDRFLMCANTHKGILSHE